MYLRQRPQPLGVKMLVGRKVADLDSQQILDCSGDIVTLDHLRGGAHRAFEFFLRGLGMQAQPDHDIGDEADPRFRRVDHRAITGNHAAAFQILNPSQASRRRKANPLGKVEVRDPPIPRQNAQYLVVDRVDVAHELHEYLIWNKNCNLLPIHSDYGAAVFSKGCAMPDDLLYGLFLYAFVSSVTPGPNNLMLLASGVNFGFRRTIPHILGITGGHSFMVFVVGLGLAQLLHAHPTVRLAMTIASVAYLMWLAWKIANAAPPQPGAAAGKPLTFLQAAAFQWVNPKAWSMALTAITLYTPDDSLRAIVLVMAIFAATNLPSVTLWAGLGTILRDALQDQRRLRLFNWLMAILLVASIWPALAA